MKIVCYSFNWMFSQLVKRITRELKAIQPELRSKCQLFIHGGWHQRFMRHSVANSHFRMEIFGVRLQRDLNELLKKAKKQKQNTILSFGHYFGCYVKVFQGPKSEHGLSQVVSLK